MAGVNMVNLRGRGTASAVDSAKTDHAHPSSAGVVRDGEVMAKIGKKQQLNRNFGFLSILALSSTLLSSWEAVGAVFSAGLSNGGPVALIYGMILSITGTLALAASLAEMASMCPISGAQYHWTAMFAPPRQAAFITWLQGWITVFAWQATACSVTFLTATQIQGLIVLNNANYDFQRWHGTLIMWALMALTYVVNVYGIKLLPLIELIGGVCHIAFFFAILIPLVVLAPRSSADFVFTQLLNEGGWQSDGVSWCIGLLTVTFCFVGFDGAIHMSEEVRESAKTVPKIIMWTIVINSTLAFAFLVAILFCIGNITNALNTPTGYPIIEIFQQATGSTKAATAMECGIIIIAFCSTLAILASVSRLTWAFARDGGLPFSPYFAYVNPRYRVPSRAIGLVTLVVVLLSLINIGSSTALNAILSLSTWALYISYLIPISLLVLKRIRKQTIIPGPWHLGRFGLFVNVYAIIYGVFICIFLPFPPYRPVTGSNMNYASPVFAGVLLFAVADWFLRGRKRFAGPLREVSENDSQVDSVEQVMDSKG